MARKLKVYRTPIGFLDAYVAAPSQKAALAAWGSSHDLFARGVAEVVEDPALTREPLAHPGTVIKRLRGSAAEQLAALPADRRKAKPEAAKAKPARPPPSRAALDAAEAALAEAEKRHAEAEKALAAREAALARERREMEKAQANERARLTQARDAADTAYHAAVEAWEG